MTDIDKDGNLRKAGFIANVDPEARAKDPELFLNPDEPYAHVYGLTHALARVRFEQHGKYYDHEGKVVEITTEF